MYQGSQIQSTGSVLAGYASQPAPEPQREIPREWETVCQRVDFLEAQTTQLLLRLSPLMSTRPAEAINGESAQASIGTDMGNDLYCLSRRIAGLSDRLSVAIQDLAI